MDVQIGVTVDKATVTGYGGRINAKDLPGVRRSMQRRTKRVERVARATAPVRTGKMKRSIKSRMRGSTGEVSVGGPGIDYTWPVIRGARPHTIVPRRAKALRFQAGGKIVFAKRVAHPGNKPNLFLVRALRAAVE